MSFLYRQPPIQPTLYSPTMPIPYWHSFLFIYHLFDMLLTAAHLTLLNFCWPTAHENSMLSFTFPLQYSLVSSAEFLVSYQKLHQPSSPTVPSWHELLFDMHLIDALTYIAAKPRTKLVGSNNWQWHVRILSSKICGCSWEGKNISMCVISSRDCHEVCLAMLD